MEDNSYTSNKANKYDLEALSNISNRINKFKLKQSDITANFQILNRFLNTTDNLIEFIQKLFELKSLKGFETIHLFIHQKGLTRTDHLEVLRNTYREYSHKITDFSSFFQSIKKSKNRSFGQSKISGFNLEILGTFLAHEFSLSNYNLILIISRNDFLPQTEDEIRNFKILTSTLSSYIEIKLEQNLVDNRKFKLKQGIELSPFELEEGQGEVRLNRKTLNHLDHGDIFHHERVSLLGELLNTLRHELSNPIFGLELTTQLLLLEEHNEEQLPFVEEIQKSIKRSQSILENFTHLYKETNEFELIDPVALINEVFTLTKSESRHLKKEVITTENEFKIFTNSTWLAQIIFNLVINSAQACKNVKNAFLKVQIDLKEDFVNITLFDNGPGIPVEKQPEIFKPFYTTKEKGTGLGLAICHSLSKKLKGKIEYLHSDKGASFHIKLPYENISN